MANGKKIKIVGFGGSLRKGSYNHRILVAAKEAVPKGATYEIAEIYDLPLYNTDMEKSAYPKAASILKKKINDADAILIATPEHNFTMAAAVKNAMEWITRPYPDNPFNDKPVAIASASTGYFGGIKAQLALRQSLVYLNAHALNDSLTVSYADKKFDARGRLTDKEAKEKLGSLLEGLVNLTKRLNGGR